ncbi:MAG: DUF2909 domain-containing protein [Proteobacteria bacterium]|nr:DUF2909 domain-containing protein [Pseudomonadota bacterium]
MKVLIVVTLIGIVASLGKALFHMSSGRSTQVGHSAMMVRALSVRIGLSVALFILLMIAWYLGAISPHSVQ